MATSNVNAAIAEIQDVVGAISGIKAAPDQPPEDMNEFPFAVAYSDSGAFGWLAKNAVEGRHNIKVEIHVQRQNLPYDVAAAMAYCHNVPIAILTAANDGTFTAIKEIGSISYEFGPLGWLGTATMGFAFRIEGAWTQDAV